MLVGTLDFGTRVNTAGLKTGAKAVNAAFSSSLKSLMGAGFGLRLGQSVADALINSVRDFVGKMKDSLKEVKEEMKSTLELGFSDLGAFQGLKWMSDAPEEFAAQMEKFQKTLGGAAMGGANPFAKLGLNAGELAGMSTEEQLLTLADAFEKVGMSAQSTALAAEIFGKSAGSDFAERLSGGRKALEQEIARYKELTGGMTNADGVMAQMASRTLKELKIAWDGMYRSLAVELAPAIKVAVEWITELGISARGIAGLGSAGETMEGFIAILMNAAQVVSAVFQTIQLGIMALVEAVVDVVAMIAQLDNLLPQGMRTGVGEFMSNMSDAMVEQTKAKWGDVKAAWGEKWWGDTFLEKTAAARSAASSTAANRPRYGMMPSLAGEWRPAAALLAGSVGAYSAAAKSRALGGGESPMLAVAKQQAKGIDQVKANGDKTNALLEELRNGAFGGALVIDKAAL